jgi:hypothetical protein
MLPAIGLDVRWVSSKSFPHIEVDNLSFFVDQFAPAA